MSFTAGQRVRASALNLLGNLVGRNSRTAVITSTGTTAATATRVLSTSAPVVAGRSYRVRFRTNLRHSVNAAVGEIDIHFTTNNVEPAVTDTTLTQGLVYLTTAGTSNTIEITATYDATATGTFRVMAAIYSSVAGTITLAASATNPTELDIEDIGDTISATGTVY